jgi:ABC-type branched-subunit amino acid transport system substrate-binding protein
MKRIASIFMLLVLLTAVLAACGAPTGETGASPAAETGASPAAETGASPAAETGPEATGAEATPETDETPEATTETDEATPETGETPGPGTGMTLPNVGDLDLGTIRIATQSPLSGPQSALGTSIRDGAQLAVNQLAEQAGLDIELVALDDQAQEPVGSSNANQIATDQNILCVVGHLNSGVALAALPIYRDAGLAMVSPANTNPRITEEFGGTAFRLVGRDDVQGVVAENFARDTLEAQSVYILHDQTAYGEGIATFFQQQAQEDGLQVLGFAGTQETSVFDPVLTPIQAANPDIVFWGGIYSQAGPLLQQMRERGIEATFMGPDGIDSPEFARLAGEAAVGTYFSTVAGPPSEYPAAAQFAQDFQEEFGRSAPPFSPQAYDAAATCLTGIAQAAIEANGKPTREQVRDAIANLEPIEGVTGTITFDEKGDRVPATYFIVEVTSADPNEWGENRIVESLEIEPPEE